MFNAHIIYQDGASIMELAHNSIQTGRGERGVAADDTPGPSVSLPCLQWRLDAVRVRSECMPARFGILYCKSK